MTRRHLKIAKPRKPLRPIDGDRVGRVLLNASRDGDPDSVIDEAAAAGELPQLASALAGFLVVAFRHMHGDDREAMESNAYSLISDARSGVN